jgi:hypothetical protein
MKTLRTFLVAILVSTALMASAQGHRSRTVPNNGAALNALQSQLATAVQQMEAALPIYDGYRVKSVHAAHEALVIVDKVISGAHAAVRPPSTARDMVSSGAAKSKYTAERISASQTHMQNGLNSLEAAANAFQSAMTGQASTKRSEKLAALLQRAITNARTSLDLHQRTRA